MVYIIKRREALKLGASARRDRRAPGKPRRRRFPWPSAGASWKLEKGAPCACCGRRSSSSPTRCLPRQHREVHRGDRRPGADRHRGWEDRRPKTAVAANTGAGPDMMIGLGRRPAHLCGQAARGDRHRRGSRRGTAASRAGRNTARGRPTTSSALPGRRDRPTGLSQVMRSRRPDSTSSRRIPTGSWRSART